MHIEHFIAGKDRHLIYVDIGDTVHDEEIIAPCLLIPGHGRVIDLKSRMDGGGISVL